MLYQGFYHHQFSVAGVAEVVAHAAGNVDPSAKLQGHPLLVNEEVALPLDAHEPVAPGMGVDAALGSRLQGEQTHDIVVPKTPVGSEYDLLGGVFNKMAAGDHRQVPDIAGILAHAQLPFPIEMMVPV